MPTKDFQDDPLAQREILTEKALLERPSFSIRFRITSAFALAIFFSLGIGIVSIVFISLLDSKQVFFEQAETFSTEIQEARRYEKNYFLWGAKSDLYDVLSHTHAAKGILESAPNIRNTLKREAYVTLSRDLDKYESLLNQLASEDFSSKDSAGNRTPENEERIRHFGHQILTYAADMVKQERLNVHSTANSLTRQSRNQTGFISVRR